MAVSDDKKLEVLNDHYKDTFSHIRNYLKKRDRLFFYLLIVLTVMFLQVVSPSESDSIISKFISKRVGEDIVLNTSFIRSVLWFFLLSLVLTYCQTAVLIERQYAYLHKLEEEVTVLFSSKIAFTREGKSYLKDYPKLSDWANTLYVWIFPPLLLVFVVAKIFIEFPGIKKVDVTWVVSLFFCVMTWVTVGLYLYFKFKQMREWQSES